MPYSVQEFLTFLKLEEYLPNFINNDINNLHDVGESVLINIGVDKVGHRKRFLGELEKLLGTGMHTIKDDKVHSNTSAVDFHDDDEPPPLPPKQKNLKEISPGKPQKPPKPPRTTLPVGLQKPIQPTILHSDGVPSQRTSELQRQSNIPSSHEPPVAVPKPPIHKPPVPPRIDLEEYEATYPTERKLVKSNSTDMLSFDESPQNAQETRVKAMINKRNTMYSFESYQAMQLSGTLAAKTRAGSHRVRGSERAVAVDISKTTDMRWLGGGTDNASSAQNSISNDLESPSKKTLAGLDSANKLYDNEEFAKCGDGLGGIPMPIKNDKDELISIPGHTMSEDTSVEESQISGSYEARNISIAPDLKIDLDNILKTKNLSIGDDLESPNSLGRCSAPICTGYNSADDISDDEDIVGIPVTMKKDKDQLIDIVSHSGCKGNSMNGGEVKKNIEHRKSRFFHPKSGYLIMPGEGRGKRWIEFTGSEIKCFKDRNGILKLTIPILKISNVIWELNAKKPTFHLETKSKKYTFTEPNGDHNALTIWANVILEGVMEKGDEDDDEYSPGGVMAYPDIAGYLSKEGHSILHEIRRRYVVIKENKLCYYNSKEDFDNDLDFISCLEMALVSLKAEDDKLRLILHTHTNKTYTFAAEDVESFNSWKEAIETSIQYGIGDDTIKNQIQENQANMKCADCGEDNPIYASINLLVVTCSKCTGFHREMGCHISKARSLLMDKYVWTPSLIKLFQTVGNDRANSLWAHKMPTDDCIAPRSTRDDREQFIFSKYKEKKYFYWSPFYGQPEELGEEIRKVVVTDDVLETLRLIISEADIYYVPEGCPDQRTPYELAKDAGKELQRELLYHFSGHLTKEERKELQQQRSAMQQTTGVLQVKTTRNDTLKERQCTLNGKKIEMKKLDKLEDSEIIDLTKLEEMEIDKEDQTTLILKFPERSYFLKAYLPEEANTWYRAIHNKQVFGVAIENQDYNDKKIPYMIGECISFMEQHSLTTEGIYRLNGSQITIKKLTLLFNQDARNIRLSIDDFPDIHAVAGLIKLYFRQLPDPLLTKALYTEWITNAEDTVTEEGRVQKLYRYKSLLQELPPCNYTTLRFLILHLSQVVSLSKFNKMALPNVIVIFGPILASCGNTVDQAWLKREYSILSDMVTYYQWLFQVSEVEVKVLQGMTDFHLSTQQQQQQPTITDSSTMVTIFVGPIEDQMKMTQTTKPSEVCLFCLKKHQLSANTNWGLFETTMEGDLERLVHSTEYVLKLAETMGVKRKLVVKCNDVTDLISTHKSNSLCISGNLHFSKGDKWRKNCYVEIKTGNIRIYRQKGNNKEEENLPIHEIELFIGSNAKKKPPAEFGFALSKMKDSEFRYFCGDEQIEVNKFIANILLVRYPSGMWSPISDKTDESGLSVSLDSPSWGRQSALVRPSGTSNRLLSQLDKKRQTLKNIFK